MKFLTNGLSLLPFILAVCLMTAGCGSDCAGKATAHVSHAIVKISTEKMTCSGVVVDVLGYIVTAYAAADTGGDINVSFRTDEEVYKAEVVWKDENGDIAIVKLKSQPQTITAAMFGEPDKVEEGDTIVAFSHLPDDRGTSKGAVTSFVDGNGIRYMQTDVELDSPYIGGPVVNCDGEIIGILCTKTHSSMPDTGGCAVPLNVVKARIDTLVHDGALTVNRVEIPPASITQESAIIEWRTNRPSTAVVYYETDKQSYMPVVENEMIDDHRMMLHTLQPDTRYNLVISVKDADNFEYTTSGMISFQTKKAANGSVIDPSVEHTISIETVRLTDITDTSVTISWQTKKEVIGKVLHGLTTAYGSEVIETDKTSNHTVTVTSLIPNTTYHYKVACIDGSMESPDGTFTTYKQVCNKIGCRAPGFSLQSLSDNMTDLNDFAGKKLIILFTGTSCSTCMQQVKYFQEIYDADPQPDYAVILIAGGESKDKIRSSLKLNNVILPVLLDNDGRVTSTYRPYAFPGTFFIDESGIIQRIKNGPFGGKAEVLSIISSFK